MSRRNVDISVISLTRSCSAKLNLVVAKFWVLVFFTRYSQFLITLQLLEATVKTLDWPNFGMILEDWEQRLTFWVELYDNSIYLKSIYLHNHKTIGFLGYHSCIFHCKIFWKKPRAVFIPYCCLSLSGTVLISGKCQVFITSVPPITFFLVPIHRHIQSFWRLARKNYVVWSAIHLL